MLHTEQKIRKDKKCPKNKKCIFSNRKKKINKKNSLKIACLVGCHQNVSCRLEKKKLKNGFHYRILTVCLAKPVYLIFKIRKMQKWTIPDMIMITN